MGKTNAPSVFVNKVLLEHSHIVSVATFTPQLQNQVVATETMWSTKPKIFTICLFTEKIVGKTMENSQDRNKLKSN